MPFYIGHAGTKLVKFDVYGNIEDVGPLPEGVTISADRPCQFAVMNRRVIIANGPSHNLQVDDELIPRLLSLNAPLTAPTVAASSTTGNLTGDYTAGYTFAIKNRKGVVVAESPLSPTPDAVTLDAEALEISGIEVSAQPGVNCRRIYRVASSGAVYYWTNDIDNNSQTTYHSDELDAALDPLPITDTALGTPPGSGPIFAPQYLGTPGTTTNDGTWAEVYQPQIRLNTTQTNVDADTCPDRLKLLCAWSDRLFAASVAYPDNLRFSDSLIAYAWLESNYLTVGAQGKDSTGINGFLPRRDELGIGKLNELWKLTGSGPDDYALVQVVNGVGVTAPRTCVVVRNTAYFLYWDGVYQWNDDGVTNLATDTVRPWFTTDTYFERSYFPLAFMHYDERRNVLKLHLVAAGSTTFDRWVEYHLGLGKWFGPHKTAAFTPSCGGQIIDDQGVTQSVIAGTDGYLRYEDADVARDSASAIDLDILTQPFIASYGDVTKYFGDLTILKETETEGSLTVTPVVDGVTGTASTVTLATERTRAPRLGVGRRVAVRMQNAVLNQPVEVWGIEAPTHQIGRR